MKKLYSMVMIGLFMLPGLQVLQGQDVRDEEELLYLMVPGIVKMHISWYIILIM
jgi:hypothetical protein